MLTKEECLAIHKKNAGRQCYLEYLASNDLRIVLHNNTEILHTFLAAEYDENEQAQAARLCAAINFERRNFIKEESIFDIEEKHPPTSGGHR